MYVRSITGGAPSGTTMAGRQPGPVFIVEAVRFSPWRGGAFGTSIAVVRCLPAASVREADASERLAFGGGSSSHRRPGVYCHVRRGSRERVGAPQV